MAISSNLMPIELLNARRTREERSENAKKAGKASGEARNQKANFKKALNLLLTAQVETEWTEQLQALGLDSTYESVINASMILQAAQGNVKAYEAIAKYAGQLNPEEETEESIAGNAKANSMKEAASETSTEASDEEKKPAGPTTIIVVVNRSPVTLSGKPSYVFVDVFDKIDFDLTRPKGKNIVTSLNGKPAQYMETLHDGDVIDIYWSN